MRVRWLRAALRHLDDQITYIAADNPVAAGRASARIRTAVAQLADYPQMGRVGRVPGTRELVIAGTPWVVVYRITNSIEILRVLHGASAWPPRR